MNNPFDYIPSDECQSAFQSLLADVESLRMSCKPEDRLFFDELSSGKMLGVLIARDYTGAHHTLYAFSGQIGNIGFHRNGFVEPVFDYLNPDGYFKTKEAEISRINEEIKNFENEKLRHAALKFKSAQQKIISEIETYKAKCRESKARRESLRNGENLDEAMLAQLIRESQFEKAELRRLKNKAKELLQPYSESLQQAQQLLEELKSLRRIESERLQKWLFDNFKVLNARGESKSLSEIFAGTSLRIPPSGAGECCAPKLLNAAFKRGWEPLEIAEYWFGKPKDGELRIEGQYYPACRGKCLPILSWMLQGIEVNPPISQNPDSLLSYEPAIVFENERFCVVDKPAGMLSVPGKGRAVSLQDWLIHRYGEDREVKVAHRLDRDTSGLLIATFGQDAYKEMQTLFATRKIKKTYVADLSGNYVAKQHKEEGRIKVPIKPDWLDRPRQRVDFKEGKDAETVYKFISEKGGISRVEFKPLTGRTHQLRVHAASDEGLGMPILGDPLYGITKADRMHLHAHRIEFDDPADGSHYYFESEVPF